MSSHITFSQPSFLSQPRFFFKKQHLPQPIIFHNQVFYHKYDRIQNPIKAKHTDTIQNFITIQCLSLSSVLSKHSPCFNSASNTIETTVIIQPSVQAHIPSQLSIVPPFTSKPCITVQPCVTTHTPGCLLSDFPDSKSPVSTVLTTYLEKEQILVMHTNCILIQHKNVI